MTSDGFHPLDPRVRTLWHLMAGLATVPVLVGALVLGAVGLDRSRPLLVAVAAVAVVAAPAAAAVGPRLRYARWRWRLTDEGLEVHHGVLRRVVSAIPVFRVQQIDVVQGPIERWFGVVRLQITTASSASDGVLPGIDADRAEAVRRELMERVTADDGV